MFKCINGWTKDKMLAVLKKRKHAGPAVDQAGYCQYRAKNGNKCAVGMFLPPGHDGAGFHGIVGELLQEYPDLASKLPLSLSGLIHLQNTHDIYGPLYALRPALTYKNAKAAMIAWVKWNVK